MIDISVAASQGGPPATQRSVARRPAPPLRSRFTGSALWQHRWFVLCALSLAGFGGWQSVRVMLGPAVVVDKVSRGNLVETVVASGHVQTPFRVEIGSQITGTVEDVLVDEGQRVAKGDVLVSIEASELRAAEVQAEGAVAQAEARLRQLRELTQPAAREALAQGRAMLLDAQNTFDRTAALAAHGNATRAALDDAQKNLDIARTLTRTAELQVFTSSPGGSDYVMAETQLSQAKAALATSRARLGYATIAAPRNGVLIARSVERGTIVQPGRALLVLAPDGPTQLVVQIDEKNLGRLKIGQNALASADAYLDQTFPAEVAYINPGIDISRASVEVKLNVPSPPPYLLQDMTVSVDVEVARRTDTLILPSRDVYDSISGKPWAMLVGAERRAHKQPLRLGIRGTTHAEVLEGVSEGDLAIPSTAGVRTGQRVRPVLP